MKCAFAIRQMAYGAVPDALDEYMQMRQYPNCPVALRAQFCRGDHGSDPFILLEAIASWIWHAFFGVSGMNNDVNVLRQSPIFNDLKAGKASDGPFMDNGVSYKMGYYVTDGISPEYSVLMKLISNPGANDNKRIMYKMEYEAARRDVERDFVVLKKKCVILKQPTRGMSLHIITDIM
ncbi:ALP1-like protein [Tanacetum coccineum]